MEPTELINPGAQHRAGSVGTHLKDKSVLEEDENHPFCGMIYNSSNNPAEPEAVKCWTTAPNWS